VLLPGGHYHTFLLGIAIELNNRFDDISEYKNKALRSLISGSIIWLGRQYLFQTDGSHSEKELQQLEQEIEAIQRVLNEDACYKS
jgi:hypothetical protein